MRRKQTSRTRRPDKKRRSRLPKFVIFSAHQLPETTIEQIKAKFGKQENPEIKIDSTLIGGIRIQCDDQYFDATISTQLQKLKKKIFNTQIKHV